MQPFVNFHDTPFVRIIRAQDSISLKKVNKNKVKNDGLCPGKPTSINKSSNFLLQRVAMVTFPVKIKNMILCAF